MEAVSVVVSIRMPMLFTEVRKKMGHRREVSPIAPLVNASASGVSAILPQPRHI